MTHKEHLRHYLPDFIAGKVSSDIAAEIQQQLQTDAAFRKEYEALREVWTKVHAFSSAAPKSFQVVPPFYFETFADRVMARLRARQQPLWVKVWSWLKEVVLTEQRYELAGALAGALLAFLLIISVWQLDQYGRAVPEPFQPSDAATAFATTLQYAAEYSPEAFVMTLSDDELASLWESFVHNFSLEAEFKTLSNEEVEALLKAL